MLFVIFIIYKKKKSVFHIRAFLCRICWPWFRCCMNWIFVRSKAIVNIVFSNNEKGACIHCLHYLCAKENALISCSFSSAAKRGKLYHFNWISLLTTFNLPLSSHFNFPTSSHFWNTVPNDSARFEFVLCKYLYVFFDQHGGVGGGALWIRL